MFAHNGRYSGNLSARVAEGWTLERLTAVSRLFCANGLRTGPDGRIYIAQVSGSQISALDLQTGSIEVISPLGGQITAPDDLAFDAHGNLYATEVMDARVSVRAVDGATRVLCDALPSANGITFHQDRLFIDECRLSGRVLELDLHGGAPKVLLENVPLPNALAPGPDGMLYFPVIGTDEIWRIHPDGGAYQRVVSGLQHPVAVKFDFKGYIVSPQTQSGEVLRIDPRSGERTVLARLDPGLDNLTFVEDRLFVSHLTDGRITEVLGGGESREVLPGGFQRPMDLAIGDDGKLYIADNVALYVLSPGAGARIIGRMFTPGYPGGLRGLTSHSSGCFAVTTTDGQVSLYRPWAKAYEVLAKGLDQPYGIAIGPGGAIVVAEFGTGRVLSIHSGTTEVLASGLHQPIDVVIDEQGSCLVSEAGAGRVVKLTGTGVETVVDGLHRPHGIVVHAGLLYIVDAGAQQLIEFDRERHVRRTIGADLPVGAPPGVTPKPLRGAPPFTGPLGPFAGIAADAQGTLYVSADGEGSVIAFRRDAQRLRAS